MADDRCTCSEQEDLRSRPDLRRNRTYKGTLISKEAFSAGGQPVNGIPFPLYVRAWDSVVLTKSARLPSSLNKEPQS